MPVDALSVTGGDGAPVLPQNLAKGKTRSSFDLELRAPGTYRVAVAGDLVMARWEEDGKAQALARHCRGNGGQYPAKPDKLELEQIQRRVETFVTVGTPSEVKSVGTGLELVPVRHPKRSLCG